MALKQNNNDIDAVTKGWNAEPKEINLGAAKTAPAQSLPPSFPIKAHLPKPPYSDVFGVVTEQLHYTSAFFGPEPHRLEFLCKRMK